MVTCYIKYKLNLDELWAFEEYGKIWIKIINELGGNHLGYFLPSDDPKAEENNVFSFQGLGAKGDKDIGVAIFSFPNWEAYEKYRVEAKNHPLCDRANRIVEETKCFVGYERSFMRMVEGK